MIAVIKKYQLVWFALALVGISSLAMATPTLPSWKIDSATSSITFTATQNNAPVTGQFKLFSGDINFDPSQLASSHIKIMVDMNSVSTAYPDVMNTLKTADWFNVASFPQAIFSADKFVKTGNNTYQADGTLMLRGKTLPMTLNFTLDNYTATNAKAKGTATVARTQFGVGQGDWSSTKAIKDDVQINFIINAKTS